MEEDHHHHHHAHHKHEEEEVRAYVARFAGVPSRVRVLPPEGSLQPLLALACPPPGGDGGERGGHACEGLLVGLDLDQTLVLGAGLGAGSQAHGGLRVRGGQETERTLHALWAAGARLAVVTAAPASTDNARLVASLLRRLGLSREFASAALDPGPLLALLRRMADASSSRSSEGGAGGEVPYAPPPDTPEGGLARETKRTVGLLALSTGRRPADLVRIGYSTVSIDPSRTKASYRLAQLTGPNAGGWSALQWLHAHEERSLCAVECLASYVALTAPLRARQGGALPDRLFLSPEEAGGPLTEKQITKMLEDVVLEAGLDPLSSEVRELFHDSAELVTLDGGVKIARYRHIMCARYNKPEALLDFITSCAASMPRKVIFVDDNSDNVFNVFHFFASRQLEELAAGKPVNETTTIISCWYPPPPGGKSEPYDPALRVLIQRMASLPES